MAAHILLSVNAVPNPLGYDRSVVAELGDVITCAYNHVPPDPAPVVYEWQVIYRPLSPDGTASVVSGATGNLGTFAFSAPLDNEGSYLIRLITDKTLPTESFRYLRIGVPTRFGMIPRSAAGETLDPANVSIPEDIDLIGWTDVENQSFHHLNSLVRRASTAGRILYVDANRGRDKTNPQDDLTSSVHMPGWGETSAGANPETGIDTPAAHYGDFSKIQTAIDWAVNQADPAPSVDEPWVILIQPGYYVENLTFAPFVHLVGLGTLGTTNFPMDTVPLPFPLGTWLRDYAVTIETKVGAAPGHTYPVGADDDVVTLSNLFFLNNQVMTRPLIWHTGASLTMTHCSLLQLASSPTQGPAYLYDGTGPTYATISDCTFASASAGADITGTGAQVNFDHCSLLGGGGGLLVNSLATEGWDSLVSVDRCYLFGSFSLRSCGTLKAYDSKFDGDAILDTFGEINKTLLIESLFNNCSFSGQFTMDASGIIGATPPNYITVRAGSCMFANQPTFTGAVGRYNWSGVTDSKTVYYNPSYADPTTPGTPSVDPAKQLTGKYTVQDAIDQLANAGGGGSAIEHVAAIANPATLVNTLGMDVICSSQWAGPGNSQIYLPTIAGRTSGSRITVKDALGSAAARNILISPSLADVGTMIDGIGGFVINSNWGAVTLYLDVPNNMWHVI